jgi:hypothetical protein
MDIATVMKSNTERFGADVTALRRNLSKLEGKTDEQILTEYESFSKKVMASAWAPVTIHTITYFSHFLDRNHARRVK